MNYGKKKSHTSSTNNMEGMIETFTSIANNPLSKLFLKKTLDYCEKDKNNRIEVGLELFLGKRKNACIKCKLLSKVIAYIINKGFQNFGVSKTEFMEVMKDPYWVRGLSSVLKGIALFGVQKPFVPGAPFQVVWNITKKCNLACQHCYENAGSENEDELNSEQILKGIDILAEAGVTSVAFSGGEPTIHPHIHRFIKYAKDQGMFVSLATNGYSLSNKNSVDKYVDSGLEFVQISLDGLDPNTHDSFRGVSGAWDKSIQAILNCVEADIFVEVATTVTEHNFNEISSMIDFVRNLGAQWFMLYKFIPTGKGREIMNLDLKPDMREELLETAYLKNGQNGIQVLSTAPQYARVAEMLASKKSHIIPTHFYNPEYTNNSLTKLADFVGGCGAGRFYLSLEPNGDIFPCVFFPHNEDIRLGNILSDDFNFIWENDGLLLKLRNKKILHGHCGGCDSRNICGGCRARAYSYFDDVLAPDPGCINNQDEWVKIKNELLKDSYELSDGRILIDL